MINKIYFEVDTLGNRILIKEFIYKNIVVPIKFVTDGNTIFRLLWWFLGKYEFPQASLTHDFLYSKDSDYLSISRFRADFIFKSILIKLARYKYKMAQKNTIIQKIKTYLIYKIDILRINIAYKFVSWFGFIKFKKN